MKGTPETPQCGFSRASIQILGIQGVDPQKFTAFNVLEDQDLRQGTHSSRICHDREADIRELQVSRNTRIGQPYLNFTWTRSLLGVVIFSCRCIRMVNLQTCLRRKGCLPLRKVRWRRRLWFNKWSRSTHAGAVQETSSTRSHNPSAWEVDFWLRLPASPSALYLTTGRDRFATSPASVQSSFLLSSFKYDYSSSLVPNSKSAIIPWLRVSLLRMGYSASPKVPQPRLFLESTLTLS